MRSLLTLSSESRSHGLYFCAIVNELTATAVAMVVFVVRFEKKTSIEVSSSRTDMRYAPYLRFARQGAQQVHERIVASPHPHTHQYMRPSYFSKYCCIARSSGDMVRSSSF